MVISQMATWLLTIPVFVLLPRYFGAEDLGRITIATSLAIVPAAVAELGMNVLITREVARNREVGARRIATAFWIRIVLSMAGGAAIIAAAPLAGYSATIVGFAALITIRITIEGTTTLGYAAVQGAEQMQRQAVVDVLWRSVSLAGLVAVIIAGYGVAEYLVIGIVTATFGAILMQRLLRAALPISLLQVSVDDARYLVKHALPFWGASIVLSAYPFLDVLTLSQLADATAVGVLSAPQQALGTLIVLPHIVTTVAFPIMVRQSADDTQAIARQARSLLRLVISASVPITIGLIGIGVPVALFLFGREFERSGPVIVAGSVGLIAIGANVVLNRVLAAANRERAWMSIMVGGLIARIPLNIGLILLFDRLAGNPAVGLAASIATIEWAAFIVGLQIVPGRVLNGELAIHFAKLTVSGVVAAVVLASAHLAVDAPPLIGGVAAILTYAVLVAMLRAHTVSEITSMVRWGLGHATTGTPAEEPPADWDATASETQARN